MTGMVGHLLEHLPDGEVLDLVLGARWTAVAMQVEGERRCGLAATMCGPGDDFTTLMPSMSATRWPRGGRALAELAQSEDPVAASVGMAAINSLLPRLEHLWLDLHAEAAIARLGAGRVVAMVGRFPFAEDLADQVGELVVLERDPGPRDLPEAKAPDILPRAQVVAITGMAVVNHSIEELLRFCSPNATVIVVGPSTPLSPLLFEDRPDLLSGAVVNDVDGVLHAVRTGAAFREIRRAGARLVTMARPGTFPLA